MSSILHQLLERGDCVSIKCGRLCIRPASGKPVPDEWLCANSAMLCSEILATTGIEGLQYLSYTTGYYGTHKAQGLTLQLASLTTGEIRYSIFNCDLKRARSGKGGSQGEPLPKGKFRVGRRSNFYRFWIATQLPLPNRLAKLPDYMGHLKSVLLTGAVSENNRIVSSKLKPLDIPQRIITEAIFPDKIRTSFGQGSDNIRTRKPDKELPQTQTDQGLQPFSTACQNNCGNKVIRKYEHKEIHSISITPRLQTHEEWRVAYGDE